MGLPQKVLIEGKRHDPNLFKSFNFYSSGVLDSTDVGDQFCCFALAKKNLVQSSPFLIQSILHCCLRRVRLEERMEIYLSLASCSLIFKEALSEEHCNSCCSWSRALREISCCLSKLVKWL